MARENFVCYVNSDERNDCTAVALANLLENVYADSGSAQSALEMFAIDRPYRAKDGRVPTTSLPALVERLTSGLYKAVTYVETDIPLGVEKINWDVISGEDALIADRAYDDGSLILIEDIRIMLHAGPSMVEYRTSKNLRHCMAHVGENRIIDYGYEREIDFDDFDITDVTLIIPQI